jgi:RNA polymerase sigma-70 factor, ECF subfamily
MVDELREAWVAARSAWPSVEVGVEEFAAYVAERAAPSAAAAGNDRRPRTTDLYLACACSRGDNAALAAFERAYFPEIDHAIRRHAGRAAPPADEVRQLIRHKLFVAEPGERPKIADYSGRGDLRSWFRVAVSRVILNLSTRPSPEVPFEDGLLAGLLGGAETPELAHARHAYREEFRAALDDAFSALADRERALLRYAFCERLTVEAIGALHGVHKTTAARWVVQAHRTLLERVRAALMERLRIGEAEFASVVRALGSQLEVSLERYLRAPSP